MVANTPATRKAKGRRFQQKLVKDIQDAFNLSEHDVYSVPMGVPGMDIWLSEAAREVFPFAVEAKNQENWSIPAWWEQARSNANEETGLKPVLVVTRNNYKPVALIEWDHLVELMKTIIMLKTEGKL